MILKSNNLVLAVALLLFLLGCDAPKESRVLATVNGKPLTDAFVRDVVTINAKISEFAGKKIPEKDFRNWANQEAARIFPGLVSAQILEDGLAAAGIAAGTNETRRLLLKYNMMLRCGAKTPEELFAQFGNLADAFKIQFGRSCLFEAFNAHFAAQEVTDAEIDDRLDDKNILKTVAADLDKKGKENAEKAWERLKAGEDWDKVAKECSEDKLVDPHNECFSKEWATVDKEGFGYPELAIALRTLHKGDFSKPIDVEEGLIIVKVLEEWKDKKYTLARMLFRMAEPVDIPSREEAREELRAKKAFAKQDAFVNDLKEKAVVTYPCGTNFNFKVFGE